ncbi:MAG: FAD-dependent monooxygenase [Actinomycetota bacterium]|uniref:FAD-dependent monooxygenase n=1 Tax=Mycobacterium lentiflavum TaxID=141349 RepID=A0ABY3V0P0_MYCLN|nr:FAD-dependent monooxygenase [Mycobacterium lentiflavum]MEE3067008.1 FAD-dependent monooxygenase [Actinomycetota bacterium]ULP43084.1 FAD-dependent monooxygenase [Mycobacterium lentiflavum]
MSTTSSPDVLVVGAGPVGLVAGCELARRGIRVRVIDKLTEPTDQSRAIAVHSRSLDMYARMGIVDEMVSTGVKATAMKMYAGRSRLFHVPLGGVDSAFPFSLVTAQTETERVLTEYLESLGVTVERGVELTALKQDDAGAHLTLRHADGVTELLTTPWVIGADGARSTVRKLVGTKLAGSFVGERFLLGDVDAEHQLDRDAMYTFFATEGPVVVLPMRDGRMRFLAEVHDEPGTPLNLHPTQDELQTILDQRVGGIRLVGSHWLTTFEVHHARVPAYRWGRVFLGGDAAHIHSPAGGQGMNTGMQDAFNLAWKLAAVVEGDAGERLLDSYEAERLPIAQNVISFTDRLTRVGTLSGVPRVIRNLLVRTLSHIPATRQLVANVVAEIGICYKDGPIAVGPRLKHAKVVAGEHFPHVVDETLQKQLSAVCGVQNTGHTVVTVADAHVAPAAGDGQPQILVTGTDTPVAGYDAVIADPKGLVAQRLGLTDGGRVVIRPDGYLGAVAALDDTTTIADYFATLRS